MGDLLPSRRRKRINLALLSKSFQSKRFRIVVSAGSASKNEFPFPAEVPEVVGSGQANLGSYTWLNKVGLFSQFAFVYFIIFYLIRESLVINKASTKV